MMMQMLQAGGMELLSDGERSADEGNPQGYWEYEPTKTLVRDSSWIPLAQGKVVKVIAQLLPYLPRDQHYRIIFMERDLREVLGSQQAMLTKMGQDGGNPETLAETFQRHLDLVQKQLARRKDVELLFIPHRAVIDDALEQAQTLADFLDCDLNVQQAASVVQSELYRQRS